MLYKRDKQINHPNPIKKYKNNTLQVQDEGKTLSRGKRTYKSTLLKDTVGSMTVEMVTAFPIFLFALFTILTFFQMVSVDQEIHRGMVECARQLARESHPEKTIVLAKYYWEKEVEKEYIEHSCVKQGIRGVHFLGSFYDEASGEIVLKSQYKMNIPFPLFDQLSYQGGYEIHQKVFRGYRPDLEGEEEEYVYVTEHQSVYHTSRTCSHLKLKISQVAFVEPYLQGKTSYKACELCMKKGKIPSILYITEQGGRYHSTITCSGLKRTIQRVKKREVLGLHECSRCNKKGGDES